MGAYGLVKTYLEEEEEQQEEEQEEEEEQKEEEQEQEEQEEEKEEEGDNGDLLLQSAFFKFSRDEYNIYCITGAGKDKYRTTFVNVPLVF
jgi:hypothetical protein